MRSIKIKWSLLKLFRNIMVYIGVPLVISVFVCLTVWMIPSSRDAITESVGNDSVVYDAGGTCIDDVIYDKKQKVYKVFIDAGFAKGYALVDNLAVESIKSGTEVGIYAHYYELLGNISIKELELLSVYD